MHFQFLQSFRHRSSGLSKASFFQNTSQRDSLRLVDAVKRYLYLLRGLPSSNFLFEARCFRMLEKVFVVVVIVVVYEARLLVERMLVIVSGIWARFQRTPTGFGVLSWSG